MGAMGMTAESPCGAVEEPAWPDAGARRIVFLLDASSALERRLLHGWLRSKRPKSAFPGDYDVISLPPSRRSRRRKRLDPRLSAELAAPDDPLLAPLRVAWLPGRGLRAAAGAC